MVYLKFKLTGCPIFYLATLYDKRNLLPAPHLEIALLLSLSQNNVAERFAFPSLASQLPCRFGDVHALTPAPVSIGGPSSPQTLCPSTELTGGCLTFGVEGSLYSQPPLPLWPWKMAHSLTYAWTSWTADVLYSLVSSAFLVSAGSSSSETSEAAEIVSSEDPSFVTYLHNINRESHHLSPFPICKMGVGFN